MSYGWSGSGGHGGQYWGGQEYHEPHSTGTGYQEQYTEYPQQGYGVQEQGYGTQEQGYGTQDQGYGTQEQGYGGDAMHSSEYMNDH